MISYFKKNLVDKTSMSKWIKNLKWSCASFESKHIL